MEDRAISLNAVIQVLNKYENEEFASVLKRVYMELPPVKPNEEEMAIKYMEGYNTGFCHAQAIFQKERPKGHWIDRWEEEGCEGDSIRWRCSECKELSCCNSNFCGDCGADMRDYDNEISD